MTVEEAMDLYSGQTIWKDGTRLRVNGNIKHYPAEDLYYLPTIDDDGLTEDYNIDELKLYNWID